jgi:hypothetical protein
MVGGPPSAARGSRCWILERAGAARGGLDQLRAGAQAPQRGAGGARGLQRGHAQVLQHAEQQLLRELQEPAERGGAGGADGLLGDAGGHAARRGCGGVRARGEGVRARRRIFSPG